MGSTLCLSSWPCSHICTSSQVECGNCPLCGDDLARHFGECASKATLHPGLCRGWGGLAVEPQWAVTGQRRSWAGEAPLLWDTFGGINRARSSLSLPIRANSCCVCRSARSPQAAADFHKPASQSALGCRMGGGGGWGVLRNAAVTTVTGATGLLAVEAALRLGGFLVFWGAGSRRKSAMEAEPGPHVGMQGLLTSEGCSAAAAPSFPETPRSEQHPKGRSPSPSPPYTARSPPNTWTQPAGTGGVLLSWRSAGDQQMRPPSSSDTPQ